MLPHSSTSTCWARAPPAIPDQKGIDEKSERDSYSSHCREERHSREHDKGCEVRAKRVKCTLISSFKINSRRIEQSVVPDFPSLAPSTSIAALPFVFPSLSRGMYVISYHVHRMVQVKTTVTILYKKIVGECCSRAGWKNWMQMVQHKMRHISPYALYDLTEVFTAIMIHRWGYAKYGRMVDRARKLDHFGWIEDSVLRGLRKNILN